MSRSGEAEAATQSDSSTSSSREATLSSICDELSALLVDDVILGVCFEVHRAVKMGTFFLDEMDETSEKDYEIVDEIGLDVFGQVPMKKQLECVCPSCARNLAASRFAPHLEKCMGMGRSSSRLASRKIVIVGKEMGSDDDENDHHSSQDKDDDWNYNTDRKGAKKKREKSNHSPRRSKSTKLKNGEVSSAASNTAETGRGSANYEPMSIGSTSSKKREKKLKGAPPVTSAPLGRPKKIPAAANATAKTKSSGRGSSGGAASSGSQYDVT